MIGSVVTCASPNCALARFPDNCKKMGLVFDDVVGIVEIINCKDVKIQVCVRERHTHECFHGNGRSDSSLSL